MECILLEAISCGPGRWLAGALLVRAVPLADECAEWPRWVGAAGGWLAAASGGHCQAFALHWCLMCVFDAVFEEH